MTASPHLHRRHFMGGLATVAAGGAALTLGCSTDGGPTPPGTSGGSPSAARAAALPAFIPYEGVNPTEPSLPNGTSAFFADVPDDPPTFLTAAPGQGGQIQALTIMNSSPITADKNPHWQAVNDLLGVDLGLIGAAIGDYPSKFNTTVAGNDLPDLCCVLPSSTPRLSELLEAKFADLTDHLSGDAVQDYPGLANIPSYNWAATAVRRKIFLIPSPRFALLRQYLVRTDITDAAGVNPAPANGEELADMLAGLSDEKSNRFATVNPMGLLDMVTEMMGAPNSWAVDGDGTFTRSYEDPRFADALQFVAEAWRKRQIHPESFAANASTNATTQFAAGESPLFPSTASFAPNVVAAKEADPNASFATIDLKDWDGSGEPVDRWLGPGTFYFVGLKKADPDRISEILGVVNALASPYGTAEYMTIAYGREGADYTVDDGVVTMTDEGTNNQMQPLNYVGAPAMVHTSTDTEAARLQYEAEATAMDHALARPTTGLESSTDQSKGSQVDRIIRDAITGIITGRSSIDSWESVVSTWRSSGGDTIRREYEESWAANQ